VPAQDGEICYFDARAGAASAPLFRLAAHSKPATCLHFNPTVPGLLLTASTDKKVSLWKIAAGAAPTALASADLKVGAVFSASFCGDAPFLVAAGGAKGSVSVWDTTTEPAVVEYGKSQGVGVELTERVNGAGNKPRAGRKADDDDDDEEDEETDDDAEDDE
jgi:periodic tryptophan protein 1